MPTVEIYFRPLESPAARVEEKMLRIHYAGQWVAFKNGVVVISESEDEVEA